MSENNGRELTTPDEQLVEQTRAGDQRAFAELWRRHFRSGARVARQFTSSLDADDLVAEAYTRIYQRVLAGGGPTGAFRPYLYTTIRNLASTWGAASKDVQVDDIADFEDPATIDDPVAFALDRTLTARAFRSLPERWQSVLWYTEVEGMDPHEVAPILGMSANGVAALSYRAREGLRKAWLQAHISDATGSGECQWTISRVGDHVRNGLTVKDAERMAFHLATCTKCAIISEEVDEVGSRLAIIMFPILLGGVAGGTLLAGIGGVAGSATAAAIPALPTLTVAGTGAAATVGVASAVSAPVILVGALAVAVALTGAVVVSTPPPATSETSFSSSEGTTSSDPSDEAVPTGSSVFAIDDPAHVPAEALAPDGVGTVLGGVGHVVDGVVGGVNNTVGGVVDGVGETVDGVVEPLVEAIVPPQVATVDIALSGRAMPGATVSASVAGSVYTTVAASDGRFSFSLSGLPGGTANVQLSQSGGVLGILGIVLPLQLDSSTLGIVVGLLN